MRLFLDSADISDIKKVALSRAISGVTTNPSLMAKTKNDDADGTFEFYLKKIAEIGQFLSRASDPKHLSVEVITLDQDEMVEQARRINDRFRHYVGVDLHVKIPVTLENLPVITDLSYRNIKVNATACMMPSQAKLAMDAGADIVSFFWNRMKDGGDAMPEQAVESFCDIKSRSTEIICGSIRSPKDVTDCWTAGAEIVTVPLNIIELMLKHPQTDKAIDGFQKDIDGWLKKE